MDYAVILQGVLFGSTVDQLLRSQWLPRRDRNGDGSDSSLRGYSRKLAYVVKTQDVGVSVRLALFYVHDSTMKLQSWVFDCCMRGDENTR